MAHQNALLSQIKDILKHNHCTPSDYGWRTDICPPNDYGWKKDICHQPTWKLLWSFGLRLWQRLRDSSSVL